MLGSRLDTAEKEMKNYQEATMKSSAKPASRRQHKRPAYDSPASSGGEENYDDDFEKTASSLEQSPVGRSQVIGVNIGQATTDGTVRLSNLKLGGNLSQRGGYKSNAS